MRELHLFAGAGGGILGGMLLGHVPVCAVEIDKYCRRVLQARQDDGSLPPFPIYEDVKTFDGNPWRGLVDVVAGGFPCQPFSCAGKKLGTADPRHLWPEMARIIKEVRPTYVFAENVSISAFEEPWRDLRRLGYRVPPAICVSASDVGAPHLRKRWWMLATDPKSTRTVSHDARIRARTRRVGGGEGPNPSKETTTDSRRPRLGRHRHRPSGTSKEHTAIGDSCWWETEPDVGRVVDGVASKLDRNSRIKALGNGQVPLTAATAWQVLIENEREIES